MAVPVELAQTMIDALFDSDPNFLVRHHLDSYNRFFSGGIERVFRESNPIRIMKGEDEAAPGRFRLRANMYIGGKDGTAVYYGKPVIHDEGRQHYMYPNEARLRNMTYAATVHYDVAVEFFAYAEGTDVPEQDETPTRTATIEKVFLGRFPIMLMSDLCILKGLTPPVRFEVGECRNDYGGYFIIDGKEKCIVSQEKFASNVLNIRDNPNELYLCSADIRSASDDTSKLVRTVSVRVVAPTPTLSNKQIMVLVPGVRKLVPLFILMRALGVESDKAIIETCLLDMDRYSTYVDAFIPSVHDAGRIFNRETALKYLATLTRSKTVPHVLDLLTNHFLPHMGEMNFGDKAYFLGHMVRELLKVYKKEGAPTDRDSFRFKRIELPGSLISDLFKEYYAEQQKKLFQTIDKRYLYKRGQYSRTPDTFANLILKDYDELFADRIVETGFRKAFKGNWGASAHTKRLGVIQALNRLSYNAAVSHLRKINLPLDASAKVIGPRLLHSSQWGLIDPVDTPDGGNVGLHKHMTIAARITSGCPGKDIEAWLIGEVGVSRLAETSGTAIGLATKVLMNGRWIGTIADPRKATETIVEARRRGVIEPFTSVFWDIRAETIEVMTDAGRLCRPVFYVSDGAPSYNQEPWGGEQKMIERRYPWSQMTNPAKRADACGVDEKAAGPNAAIEFLDTSEEESALIATEVGLLGSKPYTHLEIHPSFILGVMGNQVIFPENNQLPRDLFACGQMRQAVSLYHSNFQTRIDKMGVVLNNGQTPLLKSRYLEKISHEQHPYGENVIAAIMCYGGYNVEDAVLINEGSVKRGLFRTTYFNMYETREESSRVGNSTVDTRFDDVQTTDVVGLKPGYDYGALDARGLVRENTRVTENTVMIGRVTTNLEDPDTSLDASVFAKKGQLGYVDKAFITEGEEGFRIAKVRVRHERVPSIGDKFCSRCGQKGTIGLVVPEESMPFTEDGIRPDIIVNPHAFPSRMTIGQLVETLAGKACCMYGGFGDCTAFMNKGPKDKRYGSMLREIGFNSSGCQVLYNGDTGEQLSADIYMGPTYYMRLKHMVKDKINYRARGPRTVLTRQTVQGRANDGGLRIGEMERDGIVAHGASKFIQESMLVRGDEYYMAVCNQTGSIAAYNESYDLFLSPMTDGPLKFTGTLDDGLNIENVSRFGRSFSVLRVPYSFKLLMHELQTMNVSMRLVTSDNVDQLTSLQISKRGEKEEPSSSPDVPSGAPAPVLAAVGDDDSPPPSPRVLVSGPTVPRETVRPALPGAAPPVPDKDPVAAQVESSIGELKDVTQQLVAAARATAAPAPAPALGVAEEAESEKEEAEDEKEAEGQEAAAGLDLMTDVASGKEKSEGKGEGEGDGGGRKIVEIDSK